MKKKTPIDLNLLYEVIDKVVTDKKYKHMDVALEEISSILNVDKNTLIKFLLEREFSVATSYMIVKKELKDFKND